MATPHTPLTHPSHTLITMATIDITQQDVCAYTHTRLLLRWRERVCVLYNVLYVYIVHTQTLYLNTGLSGDMNVTRSVAVSL